jgi:hypothetical protein
MMKIVRILAVGTVVAACSSSGGGSSGAADAGGSGVCAPAARLEEQVELIPSESCSIVNQPGQRAGVSARTAAAAVAMGNASRRQCLRATWDARCSAHVLRWSMSPSALLEAS